MFPSLNLAYFYNQIYLFFKALFDISPMTIAMVQVIWFSLGFISLMILIFLLKKQADLNKETSKEEEEKISNITPKIDTKAIKAWQRITGYLESANPSDWKLAILEADTLLDDMVKAMGYKGENLGERLKEIEPSDFETLNEAWEAHKVRNVIAHESGYEISFKEAKRIVALYERVFKEFGYI